MFTYQERQELNTLSKELFKASSYWYNKLHKKPVKNPKKDYDHRIPTTYRHLCTFDEIKSYMLEIKAKREAILAEAKTKANESQQNIVNPGELKP